MKTTPRPAGDRSVAVKRHEAVDDDADLSRTIDLRKDEDRHIDLAAGNQANETEDRAQDLAISENNRLLIDALERQRVPIEARPTAAEKDRKS